jgi:membrane protein required for colicin V production
MSSSLFDSFPWIDVLALILVASYGVAGLVKGAIRFVVGLATVVVGLILAGTFGESLGASTWPVIKTFDNAEQLGVLTGCALVFVVTLLLGALVARLLRKAAEETDLGGVDRLLGLMFGALRGVLYTEVVVSVLMFALLMIPDMDALRADLEGSFALEVTKTTAEVCRPWFPDPMSEWLTHTLQLPPPP